MRFTFYADQHQDQICCVRMVVQISPTILNAIQSPAGQQISNYFQKIYYYYVTMDPTGCRASQIVDTDHSNVVILDLPEYLKRNATSPSTSTPTTDSFSSNSSRSISTYQIKYEQSLQKLQEMKCSDEQAIDIFEILSALEEYNTKTESIIQYLQQQLIEVKAERDAAYKSSNQLLQNITNYRTELESELRHERKGFAKVNHKHKKEIAGWQSKVLEMRNKYEEVERELQEKNDAHSSSEESWMSKVNELECELEDKNILNKE